MMSGLDHLGFSVADYEASLAFYTAALAPLGVKPMMSYDEGGKITGFGDKHPFFWVGDGGKQGGRMHICFLAASREQVEGFYAAAIAAGGKDNGGPGLRPNYHPNYYAAFVYDLDGHNIEAVFHGG
jgi:catechol 2,3-dioxygenase-like lactoylglutathione lyase family enzyme